MHRETLASAPSSPGRSASSAFFFSAPASPTHFLLSSPPAISTYAAAAKTDTEQADFEFGLAARSMSTAEELFINGQIRPGFDFTDQVLHRRTRSVSPTRTRRLLKPEPKPQEVEPVSASTSRSMSSNSSSSNSSNGSSSKRWGFIKDLLLIERSKSESEVRSSRPIQRPRNSYQNTKEMRRRTTFLPYKPGFLFGCLGFGSRGYGGAAHGFAKNVATVEVRRR